MKVKLDPNKVIYDGTSFVVIYTEEELMRKFEQLKKDLQEQLG